MVLAISDILKFTIYNKDVCSRNLSLFAASINYLKLSYLLIAEQYWPKSVNRYLSNQPIAVG